MGVSVAEYYGQRTDVETPIIQPAAIPPKKAERANWDSECPT